VRAPRPTGAALPSSRILHDLLARTRAHARLTGTARAELTTEADPYCWLNTCFLVGEGEIDEEREKLAARHVVCHVALAPRSAR
jgi:hypothetical protein